MAVRRTTSLIRIGDRSLSITAAGAGEPLVLLHGAGPGGSGVASFERNIDYLAKHFSVIVPDLPGFGASSKDLDPVDPFGDAADAIAALLAQIGVGQADIVGHSFGGATALRLAMDYGTVPRRLLLVAPAGINTTRQLPTAGLRALLGYYSSEVPSKTKLERLLRKYLVADATSISDDLIDQRYRATLDSAVLANPPLASPSWPDAIMRLRRVDLTRDSRLATINVPALVFWGALDKIARPSGGLTLAAGLPNCALRVEPRVGHWVQWETACRFNSAAIEFFTADAKSTILPSDPGLPVDSKRA